MNRFDIRTAAIVPALACLAILSGCRSQQNPAVQAAEAPPVPVGAIAIQPRPFTAVVPITGTLISRSRVEIRAETFGRVTKFPKEEGETVKAGEPVIWVEQENYRLTLKQTESAVQVAEAALARTHVLAAHAQTELDRARNLLKSGGITQKDLDLAVVNEQDARSQVRLAEAQLEQSRTAVDIARKKLADTTILAPVGGEIQRKFVNVGAYVEAPTPVMVIVDNGRLELEASVPSAELAAIRSSMRVAFKVNSYPDTKFEGRVVEISPAVDPESRAAKVRIDVPNTGRRLKSGMFAEGEILTGVERSAIIIPATAIYREDNAAGQGSVFIVQNGHSARRKVKLGREWNGSIEIAEGLAAGDILITEQSLEITDGVRVQTRGGGDVPK